MASRLFTKALRGFTLLEIRDALATAADRLNKERARLGTPGFGTFYVGPVLTTPLSGDESFLVQHSDDDSGANGVIDWTLACLVESRRRSRWWYLRRDPYCA